MARTLITLLALALVVAFVPPARAQVDTGTIVGSVKDTSGGAVPGATVTVTNTDKNVVVRTLKTDDQGNYIAEILPVGHYSVKAEARNFKVVEEVEITLNVNDHVTINLVLQVGPQSETITVEAAPLTVDLESAQSQTVITGTQIDELAINTRNYEQLVTLMPGVSTELATDQLYVGVSNPQGTSNQINFSINGGRPTQNAWNIDGSDNVDRGANLTLLAYPSLDSIQEFSVQRGQFDAEYGRSSSGQVNVITKSGTNQFHGDLYEFFRNNVLDANAFLNNAAMITRPPLRYNDFGGTVGGPFFIPGVYNTDKKKTFFFFSEEARRVLTYTTFIAGVPTADERAGIFPTPVCLNASCTSTGTQVTSIDPAAQAYLTDIYSKIPLPAASCVSACSITTTGENTFDLTQEIVRIDQIFSPKFSVFGRYENDSIPTKEPGGLFTGDALPGVSTTTTNSPGRGVAIHITNAFSSSMVNDGGYNYAHGAVISSPIGTEATQNSPAVESAITLAFPTTLNRIPDLDFLFFTQITGFGPYRDYNTDHNAFDNFTKVIGRHTLKFGFTYNWYQKNEDAANGNQGAFGFNTTDPTGASTEFQEFASFLEGNASYFYQTSLDYRAVIRQQEAEFYAQDRFRIRSNVTLTYGLRYSLFRQPIDANGNLSNFDPGVYSAANAAQIDPNTGNIVSSPVPLNGMIFESNVAGGTKSPFGSAVARQGDHNFGPRIGIAWDPFGTGKTSVRSGFGIFYDSPAVGSYEANVFNNPPLVTSDLIFTTTLDNPTGVTPFVGSAPSPLRAVGTAWKYPYTEEWSLDLQREVMPKLLIDVGYYGNEAHHLLGYVDINQPLPGEYVTALAAYGVTPPVSYTTTPQLNFIRPYLGYDAINAEETEFNSNYNGLQVSVQKRFSDKSILNVNYTWSHGLTDATGDFATPQNTYDLKAEYGPTQFDRRHILNVNYVYYLPFFKAQNGLAGHVLGGWEVSGIVSAYSGLPYTVYQFFEDPAGQGVIDGNSFSAGRPDVVGNPNVATAASGPIHNFNQWFNTSAFQLVPQNEARPGDAANGDVRGPGLQRWDISLFKNTKITERVNLQFRAEAFNVFNHVNPDLFGTSFEQFDYGVIYSTRDPRIMQLGLKLYY